MARRKLTSEQVEIWQEWENKITAGIDEHWKKVAEQEAMIRSTTGPDKTSAHKLRHSFVRYAKMQIAGRNEMLELKDLGYDIDDAKHIFKILVIDL